MRLNTKTSFTSLIHCGRVQRPVHSSVHVFVCACVDYVWHYIKQVLLGFYFVYLFYEST